MRRNPAVRGTQTQNNKSVRTTLWKQPVYDARPTYTRSSITPNKATQTFAETKMKTCWLVKYFLKLEKFSLRNCWYNLGFSSKHETYSLACPSICLVLYWVAVLLYIVYTIYNIRITVRMEWHKILKYYFWEFCFLFSSG